ncbi:MAG: hypothetical protein WD738_10190 [Pirellulales bacterium]
MTIRLYVPIVFVLSTFPCVLRPADAAEPVPWLYAGPNIFAANAGAVGIGTDTPGNKLDIVGNLGVDGDINFPNREFRIGGGGSLEWQDRVRFGAGGDGPGLNDWRGKKRAQPGANMEILPLKDYARAALDIYPTMGKKPEFDALAELTVHRIMPSNRGHEMLSISALATVQDKYGVIVEAHGTGRIKPLDFMVVQGGLLEGDRQKPFWAQVMRMKTDGTMQFGPRRTGPRNEPVDIISIEHDDTTRSVSSNQEGDETDRWKQSEGLSDSHFVRYTAKEFREGNTVHRADWRSNVQMAADGRSSFAVQSRQDDESYAKKLTIQDNGDLELPTAASALVLTSPNGKRWRITVDNDGALRSTPAEDRQ